MSNFTYSASSGKNDPMFGKFEHPIKMLIENESNQCEKNKTILDLLFNVEKSNRYAETIMGESDFDTEFLDYILAVKCVEDVSEAVNHIAAHSTGHSEAIVTRSAEAEAIFTTCVDSAAVYVNASTRFTDGGEFGLGCEMGISTQKLHARGPMGLRELTTYKYVITGSGHIR